MASIMEQEKGFRTGAVQEMLELFIKNYSSIMTDHTLSDKKKKLTKLNIQRQAYDSISNELLLSRISQEKVSLKGFIMAKAQGQNKEVNINLQEIYK